MSKAGKALRPVLFAPKSYPGGIKLKHRLATLMPEERKARRAKNKAQRITRANVRKRRAHGR